jgi:acetyl esterase/lipase
MLSRKDVRPKQTQLLLDAGFVPVSIDYRLCPETTLVEGPMTDVRDALAWARETLPDLARKRSDVRITGARVVAVGWSTGGTLALSLGWVAPSVGLQPPEAILAFYCPTDYEDEFWTRENKPFGDATMDAEAYDVYEGVLDSPVTAYNPPASSRATGGWMAKSDPRSRIVLHMNWYGQTLPVLVNGLKDKKTARNQPLRLPQPSVVQTQDISPLAQIRKGMYRTPTFIVHPTNDDLVPWQQAQRTADELRRQGVESEVRIVHDAIHLFDLYPRYDMNKEAMAAVADGYSFLSRFVS